MDTGLTEKTGLVTGAAGGIGRACARALSAEGARVVCSDVDPAATERIADEIGGEGVAGDVTSPDEVRRIVEKAAELDILVVSHGVFQNERIPEIRPDDWDRVQAVNLRGTFLLCQTALARMLPRGRGSIVVIASLAGQVGGLEAGAAYAASKAGVGAFTKSLARFAGPHGVRVNCVNPGFIETPMTAGWTPEAHERVVHSTPLGRIGTAEEVAAAVVWLASEAASFVHGAHLDVNGGLYMD